MAEPGDPTETETTAPPAPPVEPPAAHHDLDDGVGFSSPASLIGRARPPAEAVVALPEPDVAEPTPVPPPVLPTAPVPPPVATPVAEAAIPSWAVETPRRAAEASRSTRPREQSAEVEGAMGLNSVYALILFAVPTVGVSALVALLAVTGRSGPSGAIASSHFVFQQRTLWAGAVAALLGAILIAVGLGVFVLFVLAVWLILRGAGGVLKLKAGRPIANPRTWLL